MICQNCQNKEQEIRKLHRQIAIQEKRINDFTNRVAKNRESVFERIEGGKRVIELIKRNDERNDEAFPKLIEENNDLREKVKGLQRTNQNLKDKNKVYLKLIAENNDLREKIKGLQRANQDLMDKYIVSLNLYNENEINNINNKISPQKFAEMEKDVRDLSSMLFNIKVSTDSLHKAVSGFNKEKLEKIFEKKGVNLATMSSKDFKALNILFNDNTNVSKMQANVLNIVTKLNGFVEEASKSIPHSIRDIVKDNEDLRKKYNTLYNRIEQNAVINSNAKTELLKNMPNYISKNDGNASFG